MTLFDEISRYTPYNEQEERDKAQMLGFIERNDDYLLRSNTVAHFSTSLWTVNRERTKVLMIYHNIYKSWAWVGGHADGIEDLHAVALRELEEETGIKNARFADDEILSLETLTVNGHIKRGQYVPSHLHMNISYLVEADEADSIRIKEDENSGVRWFTFDEALEAASEKWIVENVYKKIVDKLGRMP